LKNFSLGLHTFKGKIFLTEHPRLKKE